MPTAGTREREQQDSRLRQSCRESEPMDFHKSNRIAIASHLFQLATGFL